MTTLQGESRIVSSGESRLLTGGVPATAWSYRLFLVTATMDSGDSYNYGPFMCLPLHTTFAKELIPKRVKLIIRYLICNGLVCTYDTSTRFLQVCRAHGPKSANQKNDGSAAGKQ